MNRIKIDKLMKILFLISSFSIVIGAYLKISHYPNENFGDLVFIYSLLLNLILSSIEMQRLRRIIKENEYR